MNMLVIFISMAQLNAAAAAGDVERLRELVGEGDNTSASGSTLRSYRGFTNMTSQLHVYMTSQSTQTRVSVRPHHTIPLQPIAPLPTEPATAPATV